MILLLGYVGQCATWPGQTNGTAYKMYQVYRGISNNEDEFSNAEIDEMLLRIARTDNQEHVCNQEVGTDEGDEIWNVELDEELDQRWTHIQEVSALKFTITQLREEISTKNAIIERKDVDIRQLREELEKMPPSFQAGRQPVKYQ